MDLRQIAEPAQEPVVLAEAKAHLRVDTDAEDALIATWIIAARQAVEAETGRYLMLQDWELRLPAFPRGPIVVPRPPLAGVLSLKTAVADGTETTLSTTDYQVDAPAGPFAQAGAIWPASGACWPSTDSQVRGAVRLRFRAGYASADAVPAPLRAAILLAVGDFYANREQASAANVTDNPAFARLIAPYRTFW
jgi:uncharacterized phiE125 gp8 family phage protein